MARFKEIHDIDWLNRTITVGPGVINSGFRKGATGRISLRPRSFVTKSLHHRRQRRRKFRRTPHPQIRVTVNHVLGLEMVLPDGEVVELGGKTFPIAGPDMLALVIGSEGTFGIVTKITCRLTRTRKSNHAAGGFR